MSASTVAPGIAYVDGRRIRRAMVAGIRKVIEGQEHLNKINVFPVADGDTGTNLALTMNSVLATLRRSKSREADTMLTDIADAALDGARGNSGAILAQFFQGVSDATAGLHTITTEQFAKAVKSGEQYAREALSKPREGTVITVMRDFADHLVHLTTTKPKLDFVSLFKEGLTHAQTSLANTPTQLDVLRKAGVVDAGAAGFVHFLDGILHYTLHGKVDQKIPEPNEFELEHSEELMAGDVHDLDYRFCTECIVTGADIDRRHLREELSQLGGSLVLAGTNRKAKIHIHVNEPKNVFKLAANYGEVSGTKADDMHQQQEMTHHQTQTVAVTIDSAADLPDEELERLNIHMIPVRLHFGDESYLDKVTITADEFFNKLDTHPVHPKTSQPSPGEFRRNFDFLASHYAHVLSINVTSWGSGTYQAAVSAADRSRHDTIRVFDSKSASIGQALQAIHAAECAQAGMNIDELYTEMEHVRANTAVYGMFPELTYTVRGGRVKPFVKKVTDFLNLAPVFMLNENGKLVPKSALFGQRNLPTRLGRYIGGRIEPGEHYRVGIAYGRQRSHADELFDSLTNHIEASGASIERHFFARLGSALGAHAGPDCLVVGLQKRKRQISD
ncbi:MAG: DAK2 domain-containing protein [Gammaproteobacteria bacterium]